MASTRLLSIVRPAQVSSSYKSSIYRISNTNVSRPTRVQPALAFSTSTSFRMPNAPTGDPNQHDASKFKDGMSGTCLCGSITVHIKDSELFGDKKRGHLCHCSNCRKVAGSFVASNMVIEEEKVTIEDKDGTLKTFEDKNSLSGNSVFRSFCGRDGNPIKSETTLYPGKVVLKMGIFPRIPHPEAEAFGLHKHKWQGDHEGVDTYEIKWAGPDKKFMSKGP